MAAPNLPASTPPRTLPLVVWCQFAFLVRMVIAEQMRPVRLGAEIAHLLRADADTRGIEGATTMRYDGAFERSRQVAVDGYVGCDSSCARTTSTNTKGRESSSTATPCESRARTSTPTSASMR